MHAFPECSNRLTQVAASLRGELCPNVSEEQLHFHIIRIGQMLLDHMDGLLRIFPDGLFRDQKRHQVTERPAQLSHRAQGFLHADLVRYQRLQHGESDQHIAYHPIRTLFRQHLEARIWPTQTQKDETRLQ